MTYFTLSRAPTNWADVNYSRGPLVAESLVAIGPWHTHAGDTKVVVWSHSETYAFLRYDNIVIRRTAWSFNCSDIPSQIMT